MDSKDLVDLKFNKKYNLIVGSDGSVYSVDRQVPCRNGFHRLMKGRLLRQSKHSHGYLKVKYNYSSSEFIHRIVADTFIPKSDDTLEVNHINGIKTDNRIENLEWVTSSVNQAHKNRMLNKKRGITKHKCGWNARIKVNKVNTSLGVYKDKEVAYKAYYDKYISIYGIAPWSIL